MALKRAVDRGELRRIRDGIYFKGIETPYGMTGPDNVELGVAVAGEGAGPAGVTAAHYLGLTTQVPSRVEIAVPGRAPAAPAGVRFTTRPARRLALNLNRDEVAVLEALRTWPRAIEVDERQFAERLRHLAEGKKIALRKIAQAVHEEHVPAARETWTRIAAELERHGRPDH